MRVIGLCTLLIINAILLVEAANRTRISNTTSIASNPLNPNIKCFPTNWDFSWFKAGDTWFTETKCKGTWQQMMMVCSQIEPGKSSIATVRSSLERLQIEKSSLAPVKRWIGGVRIAQSLWYWFLYNGHRSDITPINHFFWGKSEPNASSASQVCIKLAENKRFWKDELCHSVNSALCEIRCC